MGAHGSWYLNALRSSGRMLVSAMLTWRHRRSAKNDPSPQPAMLPKLDAVGGTLQIRYWHAPQLTRVRCAVCGR